MVLPFLKLFTTLGSADPSLRAVGASTGLRRFLLDFLLLASDLLLVVPT